MKRQAQRLRLMIGVDVDLQCLFIMSHLVYVYLFSCMSLMHWIMNYRLLLVLEYLNILMSYVSCASCKAIYFNQFNPDYGILCSHQIKFLIDFNKLQVITAIDLRISLYSINCYFRMISLYTCRNWTQDMELSGLVITRMLKHHVTLNLP